MAARVEPDRAMWVWVPGDRPPHSWDVAAFAASRRVAEAWVSVPWGGPDAVTRALVGDLRERGVRVGALGGDVDWIDPSIAEAWGSRVASTGLFDRIHLDVEVWTREDWPRAGADLLNRLAHSIDRVARATGLPVDLDLSPAAAVAHPSATLACVSAASTLTIMAYRTTADEILSWSAPARSIAATAARAFRIGVDTLESSEPHTSFRRAGSATMERALATVTARLLAADPDTGFAGIAVHDYAGWRALPG